MKKVYSLLLIFIAFPLLVYSQTLDEKLKEIDAYANTVMTEWKGPGMAIAVVKDDKVVFLKGYGVKWIESASGTVNIPANASPKEAYEKLFVAVKSKDIESIKGQMSQMTWDFAQSAGKRQNQPIEVVYSNGFTATTFSSNLPQIRDQRIDDGFGAIEVYNERDERWEDLPFVFENNGWRLAIGELFAGKLRSPGKSQSRLEQEASEKTAPISPSKTPAVGAGSAEVQRKAPDSASKSGGSLSPVVDENTVFAIASNSKAFTTASLAILVDEKKLAWDDKVSKYLPEFKMYDPWVTSELTIRDLVTHRVGLDTFSGDLLWYETTYSANEILNRVRHLKPVSSFRTRYGYQNLMFIAAGQVIEKVSGKSWREFVKERILTPLGMSRTTTSIKDLKDNAAMPHNESGGKLRVLHRGNVDGAASAAGLNSSVSDLSKWIRLQLGRGKFEGKQIFSEQRSWEMWQPYLANPISEAASKNSPTRHFSTVGMGWFLYDYHGRKVINHSGGLDGMLSYTVLVPEENLGFVVLTNSESPAFAIMMNKILDVFVNAPKRDWNAEAIDRVKRNKAAEDEEIKKADAARVPSTKPSLSFSSYAGTYADKLYGGATVAEENGKLVLRFGPSPNFVADLEHWHYNTFQIKWRPSAAYNFPRGFVTFTIDKNGRTDELKIDQPNNDFWFYELELKKSK